MTQRYEATLTASGGNSRETGEPPLWLKRIHFLNECAQARHGEAAILEAERFEEYERGTTHNYDEVYPTGWIVRHVEDSAGAQWVYLLPPRYYEVRDPTTGVLRGTLTRDDTNGWLIDLPQVPSNPGPHRPAENYCEILEGNHHPTLSWLDIEEVLIGAAAEDRGHEVTWRDGPMPGCSQVNTRYNSGMRFPLPVPGHRLTQDGRKPTSPYTGCPQGDRKPEVTEVCGMTPTLYDVEIKDDAGLYVGIPTIGILGNFFADAAEIAIADLKVEQVTRRLSVKVRCQRTLEEHIYLTEVRLDWVDQTLPEDPEPEPEPEKVEHPVCCICERKTTPEDMRGDQCRFCADEWEQRVENHLLPKDHPEYIPRGAIILDDGCEGVCFEELVNQQVRDCEIVGNIGRKRFRVAVEYPNCTQQGWRYFQSTASGVKYYIPLYHGHREWPQYLECYPYLKRGRKL
jgi:hypothetical protein